MSFGLFAQTTQYVELDGSVYDSLGNTVPFHPIIIDYYNSGTVYQYYSTTNANGYYFDSLGADINSIVTIKTVDCDGDSLYAYATVSQGTQLYTNDFIICDSTVNCSGTLSQMVSGNTVTLTVNTANPNTFSYQWDIDGQTINGGPSLTYSFNSPGQYNVCVTASNFLCSFTLCETVIVGSSPGSYFLGGEVFKGANWAESGLAILYSVDSTPAGGALTGVDTVALDSGYYYFGNLSAGIYRVLAMLDPSDSDFMSYFPTYYGDEIDWNLASDIVLTQTSTGNTINLVGIQAGPGGNGNIGGFVLEGPNKSEGDPLENVIVHLRDASGIELEFDMTDVNGEYAFDNIALGDYEIRLEVSGVMSPIVPISLTSGQESASVSFEMDTLGIRTIILGTNDELSAISKVYPNPALDFIIIDLSAAELNNAELSIVDLQGKNILSQRIESSKEKIEISNLQNGIYFLNLNTEKGSIVKKLIKE